VPRLQLEKITHSPVKQDQRPCKSFDLTQSSKVKENIKDSGAAADECTDFDTIVKLDNKEMMIV
jgi:hypothetical protein